MDAAHKATDREIARIQRRLRTIYAKAGEQVNSALSRWAQSIRREADELHKAIEDADTEQEREKAKRKYKAFFAKAAKSRKFRNMALSAAGVLYEANSAAVRIANAQTAKTYAENYNAIGTQLERGLDGYAFKPVSEEAARQYGKITQSTVDRKKDESWNAQNLTAAVVSAALLLYGVDEIVKHSADTTTKKNVDGGNRHVSDTLTDAENKGRLDSMYRAYDEGFETIKKEWVCIFDNRTRETHIRYNDLGAVPLDYEYNDGLKRPKDPNCHDLADVCNCRCALAWDTGLSKGTTRAARRGEVTGSYKEPRSFEGTETEYVSQMTYKEWMEWRSR